MAHKIENGDYARNNKSKIEQVEYIDAVLQEVRTALICPIGKYYPDKDYGSALLQIRREPKEKYALCTARRAVMDMDGVYIKSVEAKGSEMIINVLINDKERQVILNEADI